MPWYEATCTCTTRDEGWEGETTCIKEKDRSNQSRKLYTLRLRLWFECLGKLHVPQEIKVGREKQHVGKRQVQPKYKVILRGYAYTV